MQVVKTAVEDRRTEYEQKQNIPHSLRQELLHPAPYMDDRNP